MNRIYPLVPVLAAAGYLLWSASRLTREIRKETG